MQKELTQHIAKLIGSIAANAGDANTTDKLERLLADALLPIHTSDAADLATLAHKPLDAFAHEYSKLVTKDGHELRIGHEYALYRRHINTETNCAEVHNIDGWVNRNGAFEIHREGSILIESINDLYWSNASAQAGFEPAGINTRDGVALWMDQSVTLYSPYSNNEYYGKINGHSLVVAGGGMWAAGSLNFRKSNFVPTVITPRADGWRECRKLLTWHTKDMQEAKTGKLAKLWQAVGLTGEIIGLNGRVDMAGNLTEIVGSEGDEMPATFPVKDLYFWRINLLKDQIAAESPDVPANEPDLSEVDSLN